MGETFVIQVCIPDILAIASCYPDWFRRGEGLGNFMTYGRYPVGSLKTMCDGFKRGMISIAIRPPRIRWTRPDHGNVAGSWYDMMARAGSHSSVAGTDRSEVCGSATSVRILDVEANIPVEVAAPEQHADGSGPAGAHAGVLCRGQRMLKSAVDGALEAAKLQPQALYSTSGRVEPAGLRQKFLPQSIRRDRRAGREHESRGTAHSNGDMWGPESWPKRRREPVA